MRGAAKPRAMVMCNPFTRRWHFILVAAHGGTLYKGPPRLTKPEAEQDRAVICQAASMAEYVTATDEGDDLLPTN
jgi:hypothetical protein